MCEIALVLNEMLTITWVFFSPPSRSSFLIFTGAFCFVLMFYSVSDDFAPQFLHNSELHVTGDLFLHFRDNTTILADRNAIVLGFAAEVPPQIRSFLLLLKNISKSVTLLL